MMKMSVSTMKTNVLLLISVNGEDDSIKDKGDYIDDKDDENYCIDDEDVYLWWKRLNW